MSLKQSCPQGLTEQDLQELLGDDLPNFNKWMVGQTMSICDGKSYDHNKKKYFPNECADNPHGIVAYSWDVERYIKKLPILDW